MKKAYTEVVDHIKSAQSEALNYGNQIADTVHIGILEGSDISNILFQPLSDIIFSFKDSISIKISSFSYKKLNAALHENAIDIAFTLINEVADHTDIGFTKLRSIPMGLVFHRDLNLVSENKVNMEVFSKTPFFATSDGSLGFKKFIEMQKKHLQIQISNIRIMPNIPSIITNIELKQGCSIVLNTPQIENNPDLVFFPLENMSTTIVAAWNKSNENKSRERISKKIRRLIIESRKS